MKKKERTSKGIVKGTPSAVLLSILIHSALFLIAGMLVVFTVVKKEEKKFEPPAPVERPKMKLKKPKVRMKRSSGPKSRTRITTPSKRSAMPTMELPGLGGIGKGLGDGMGIEGFGDLPDFEPITIFGSGQTDGSDFIGTFYDLKRTRGGNFYGMGVDEFKQTVGRFVRSGFNPSSVSRFYRSEKKLYATCFMVPTVRSAMAPRAFGEKTGGWTWMVHYKGKLVHPEGITFRFRGQADDILVVRVGGHVVLNASRPSSEAIVSDWTSSHPDNRVYQMGNTGAIVGDWITLEPGVPLDMDVVGGEAPGGHFDMMLAVEVEGEEYPLNSDGAPVFPMFKTAEPSHDLLDAIYEWLVPGEVCLTNGPVFSDIAYEKPEPPADEAEVSGEPEPAYPRPSGLRTWSVDGDQVMEAEFISAVGRNITLETAYGRQIRVQREQLSDADREFIELSEVPDLDITFTKQSSQRVVPTSPHANEVPPRAFDWKFGVKLRQTSTHPYDHELTAEYYAVGQQCLDDHKYILLDRGASSAFMLGKENERFFQFQGDRIVETSNYVMKTWERGEKYKGYLVLVRDKRGEIVQYAASNEWLYENRENLMKLPVGCYFDRSCSRVYPTGPNKWY